MVGRRPVLVLGVLSVVTVACAATDSADEPSGSSGPTVVDLVPEESMADLFEFIEISVRIGGGDDAGLLALGVDRSSLATIPLSDESIAPAWCTGPAVEPDDDGVVMPGYLVRVEAEVSTATTGDIERFQLRVEPGDDPRSEPAYASGDSDAPAPVPASFVIETSTASYYVLDATVTFGESFDGAVFSGVTDDGVEIEGAFLCG